MTTPIAKLRELLAASVAPHCSGCTCVRCNDTRALWEAIPVLLDVVEHARAYRMACVIEADSRDPYRSPAHTQFAMHDALVRLDAALARLGEAP